MVERRMHPRRGSVIVIVIWSVAIAAVIVGAAQVLAFRQAAMGRESIAKVEARWAARAGIEETLAVLEYHTEEPDTSTSRQLYKDLELVADGQLESGDWQIRHVEDGVEIKGPQDEHAKLNINNIDRATLLELDSMTMDVADAIVDWRDTDDNAGMMGAEYDFYVNRDLGYEPRNGPFRSLAELELVAGAFPKYVRGEDQNLNGRLDPNENDGGASEPPDDEALRSDRIASALIGSSGSSARRTAGGAVFRLTLPRIGWVPVSSVPSWKIRRSCCWSSNWMRVLPPCAAGAPEELRPLCRPDAPLLSDWLSVPRPAARPFDAPPAV